MKKLIWEIGGMSSNFPLRIATLEDNLYLAFEALEDGVMNLCSIIAIN